MQGYILNSKKVKDEDTIVSILTENSVVQCYRFYGARHSSILNGYKIDFELIENIKFLPHLRNVIHLGFRWLTQRDRLIIWQQFMRLLHEHLKGIDEIDSIYYNEIEHCAKRLDKQNPKRLILESYIRILEHEGRLHNDFTCFACDEVINDKIALVRGFLPAHTHCTGHKGFDNKKIKFLFEENSTINIEDEDIDKLYQILLQGM